MSGLSGIKISHTFKAFCEEQLQWSNICVCETSFLTKTRR